MVGSGYVGLVSGACFADFGHDVVCVDRDPKKIDALTCEVMPIPEPGLDTRVSRAVSKVSFVLQPIFLAVWLMPMPSYRRRNAFASRRRSC